MLGWLARRVRLARREEAAAQLLRGVWVLRLSGEAELRNLRKHIN